MKNKILRGHLRLLVILVPLTFVSLTGWCQQGSLVENQEDAVAINMDLLQEWVHSQNQGPHPHSRSHVEQNSVFIDVDTDTSTSSSSFEEIPLSPPPKIENDENELMVDIGDEEDLHGDGHVITPVPRSQEPLPPQGAAEEENKNENGIAHQEEENPSFWQHFDYIRSTDPEKQTIAAYVLFGQSSANIISGMAAPASTMLTLGKKYPFLPGIKFVGQGSGIVSSLLSVPELIKSNVPVFCRSGDYLSKIVSSGNLIGFLSNLSAQGILIFAHHPALVTTGICLGTAGALLRATGFAYNLKKLGLKATVGTDITNQKRGEMERIVVNVGLRTIGTTLGGCMNSVSGLAGGIPALTIAGTIVLVGSTELGNLPDLIRSVHKITESCIGCLMPEKKGHGREAEIEDFMAIQDQV